MISLSVMFLACFVSTWLAMSFLIQKPIPPPSLLSLCWPIHLYPGIDNSSPFFRWVSVSAAIWVPVVWRADVRLVVLLFTPLVLIVSTFKFVNTFFLVLCFLLAVWRRRLLDRRSAVVFVFSWW